MLDKQVEKQLGDVEKITHDIRVISLSQGTDPSSRVLSEHNYSNVQALVMRSQLNIRQLILNINAGISANDSNKLTNAELSRHVRLGDLLLQQLSRLFAGGTRFVEFQPMTPLHEALAYELAKKLGCKSRFYNNYNGSSFLVAYCPGVEPIDVDVRARETCQRDGELASVEKEKAVLLEPMFFQDGKLHWHQPMEFGDRKKGGEAS